MKGKQLVYTHVIPSSSAGILAAGWTYYHGVSNWFSYGAWSFFATLTVYVAQRFYKSLHGKEALSGIKTNSYIFISSLIIILSGTTALGILFDLLKHPTMTLSLLSLALATTFFYVVPLNGRPLRELFLLKNFLVAFTWVLVLVAFPLLNETIFTPHDLGNMLAFFLLFSGLAMLFDVRDKQLDSLHFTTIPQVLGKRKTLFVASLLFCLHTLLTAMFNEELRRHIIFLAFSVYGFALVLAAHERRSPIYFALLDLLIAGYGLLFFIIPKMNGSTLFLGD